jgi:hypothetical protein
MWDFLASAAWIVSAVIFGWMIWDFFVVNSKYGDNLLVSSREGMDELLVPGDQSAKKK